MKSGWLTVLALLPAIALAQAPPSAQSELPPTAAAPPPPPPAIPYPPIPAIAYHADANYLRLPTDMNFGDPVGVAISPRTGDIYVANRSNAQGPAYAPALNQILVFDRSGKYKRELAPNLNSKSFVHAVRVDRDGYVWVVDKGSDMVVKIEPVSGHVVTVFGRRDESSDLEGQGPRYSPRDNMKPGKVPPPEENLFRMPTDVAWDSKGNTFVSDGYVNARIAVFDPSGAPVRSFGSYGHGPGQFSTAHNIQIGPDDRIYVADRANDRIQIFSPGGTFLKEVRLTSIPIEPGYAGRPWMYMGTFLHPNAPWSLCITPGPKPVLFMGSGYPGRIFKLDLEGHVLGTFGHTGKKVGEFGWVHALACPSETELFAIDETNWRVQHIIMTPDRKAEAAALAAQTAR